MRKIEELWKEAGVQQVKKLDRCPVRLNQKHRINVLALGDVGMTVLLGLELLGGDVIERIGICDINKANVERLEREMNQIRYPFGLADMPKVYAVEEEKLFDCDVVVFCASKGIPPIGVKGDVRMAQLEANREIIAHYGALAKKADFQGLMCVVSDPVDPLCRAFLDASGLHPAQIQGYGLGVMNARACYYAEKDPRFADYLEEGRAFGPHGGDLVIANSISAYDEDLSRELTELTVNANMEVRELGYKPYIAPAVSSAAVSILLTLRGDWHYGSLYLGDGETGAFLGIKNRMTSAGPVYEDLKLPEALYVRIKNAYDNLCNLK
ncbi:MAG: lactate dehydrogenase [Firmicutes bacterium]|nr:lactate dehydrogenase [Bacillota bacterium]